MMEHLKMGLNFFSRTDEEQRQKAISSPFTITLQQIMSEIAPLPPNSIVIGGCEDGMHFYLALDDPRPGSILIVGDRGSGKHRLVESVLASAVLLNPPRRLRYALISASIHRFNGLSSQAHCYAALKPGAEASALIHELTDIFAKRWAGQGASSPILLLVEDLTQVCDGLDQRSVEDLLWLIQHGPQTHIWPLVTLHAEDFERTDKSTIEAFGTYLLGRVRAQETAQAFTGAGETVAEELVDGSQFSVLFDDQWIKFWVPIVDEVI